MIRKLTTLQLALLFSVGVHAALLTVRLVDPEAFRRVFQDTPLEVVLVNARSSERPELAQAIAQAHLSGGGQAQAGRASSPFPAAALTEAGDSIEESHRQMEALFERQTQLLARLKSELATLPSAEPQRGQRDPRVRSQEEQRRQLLKLLAEIEKRINEENARPKKRYVSPSTREAVYALYYDALRRKIEAKGTQHFPEHRGRKLYGELTMVVTVDARGRVVGTEVAQSSQQPTLDKRAMAIVRAAGPFGAFSRAMRTKAEQIVVVSRFKFTRDEALETSLLSR